MNPSYTGRGFTFELEYRPDSRHTPGTWFTPKGTKVSTSDFALSGAIGREVDELWRKTVWTP